MDRKNSKSSTGSGGNGSSASTTTASKSSSQPVYVNVYDMVRKQNEGIFSRSSARWPKTVAEIGCATPKVIQTGLNLAESR